MADFLTHIGANGNEHLAFENPITFTLTEELTNRRGGMHAGVPPALLSEAMGAAAFATMRDDQIIFTVDLQTTFLAGAKLGEQLRAQGRVLKRGSHVIMCAGEIVRVEDEKVLVTGRATFTLKG